MRRKFISLLVMVSMMLTLLPVAGMASVVVPVQSIEISNSKTATDLVKNSDGTYTTDITLSVPSEDYKQEMDVVLVIDNAFGKENADASQAAYDLVAQLAGYENIDIRVGVVISGGYVPVLNEPEMLDISNANNLQAIQDEIVNTQWKDAEGRKGSNIQAGVAYAEAMLDESTVDDADKYLILISDGGTFAWGAEAPVTTNYYQNKDGSRDVYYWCNPNDFSLLWSENGGAATYPDGRFETIMALDEAVVDSHACQFTTDQLSSTSDQGGRKQYGGYYNESTMSAAFEAIGTTLEDANIVDFSTADKEAIRNASPDSEEFYVTSREAAMYHAAKTIVEASEKYNTTFISLPYNPNLSNLLEATEQFKDYVESQGVNLYRIDGDKSQYPDSYYTTTAEEAFYNIQDEIIEVIGAYSSIDDAIGDAFSMVEDENECPFTITYNGEKVETAYAVEPRFGSLKSWGFIPKSVMVMSTPVEEPENEAEYTFYIAYSKNEKAIVFETTENITKNDSVQISYTLQLDEPQTAAGVYGVRDLNGDGIIDGTDKAYSDEDALYTNEFAILNPVDSRGIVYESIEMPKPSVTYEVRKSGGGGGPVISDYTLTYESNGGTAYAQETYAYGTNVNLDKVPFRSGYTFTGWYADSELTDKINVVQMTKNKTVYAGWESSVVPPDLNGEDHFAYVVGYPDGTVQPMGNITRAEVAAIFFRLLQDEARDGNLTTTNNFVDVNAGEWYNTSVSTLTKLDIIKGMTTTEFAPNAPITRAQFAAICARFDTGKTEGISNFSDISGHWAEQEIERAVSLGWIAGYEDGTFRPDQPITRAEAMTIINRVLVRIPENASDLLDGMNEWIDNQPGTWYYLAVQEATNSHDYEMKNDINETWTELNEDPDWSRYNK